MHTYLLHQLLADGASKWPDNISVLLRDKSLTYSELENVSNRLARLLLRHGVKPGHRVGLMMEKSIESIVSVFGVLKAGAAYVPIDPASPEGRARQIICSCGIEFLIASGKAADRLFLDKDHSENYSGAVLLSDREREKAAGRAIPVRTAYWEDLSDMDDLPLPTLPATDICTAYILHTSGSTGIPKGVVISHHNALSFVEMATPFFSIRPEDRLCNHAPLNFDLSMFDIYVAIKSGAAVVLVPENLSVFPVKLAEYIERTSITVWNSVSSVLSLLAVRGNLDRYQFPALRVVIFSGEILPVKYLRSLKAHMRNTIFYNIYGQTEANSSTYYRVGEIPDNDTWKIPIGKAFPNFDVFLLNEEGQVVDAPDSEGELHVKASTVAMGYWQDKARTQERFILDPRDPGSTVRVYRTGDLARIDRSKNFIFGGRKDCLIKSRGYRIELDEIEIVLNSHPDVQEAAAIPVPDDLIGNRILGYVSLVGGADADAKSIRQYCNGLLPHYMVPDTIHFLFELPKNRNGKVDRKTLLNQVTQRISRCANLN